MTDVLDYAAPEPKSITRRRLAWAVCAISVLISLVTGLGSIKLAYDFRHSPSTDPIVGPWQYWEIDKQLNEIASPVAFLLAAAGTVMCWRRHTGRWFSVASLLIGIACWAGAVCTFP